MSEFMSDIKHKEWPTKTIKNTSYLRGRIGWQGLRASEFTVEGPYLITGTDFVKGRIDWGKCYHVSHARYEQARPIHVRNDDILITKDGTIGKVAFVENCPEKAVLNSGIFLLRCVDGSYDHKFMYHLLLSPLFEGFLRKNLAGSTITHLYQNVFERFSFPIPHPDEQKTISKVLDADDEAITKTEALIAKLKAVKQGLLHDLLTRGLDENVALRDPEMHPEQFKDSPLGKIPKQWDVFRIGTTGKIVAGATPARSVPSYWGGSIPWITPTDMSSLTSDYISNGKDSLTTEGLGSCGAYLLPVGSIVVTTRASLGLAAITQRELATNQGFKNIIPNEGWDNRFLCYKIRTLTPEMVKRASGTTFLEISGSHFGLIEFAGPTPGAEEQVLIADAINAQHQRILAEERYLSKLKAIKKGLMQDLLTDSVKVMDSSSDIHGNVLIREVSNGI